MQPIFNMPIDSIPRLSTCQPQTTKDDAISPFHLSESNQNIIGKGASGEEQGANGTNVQSPSAMQTDDEPPAAPPKQANSQAGNKTHQPDTNNAGTEFSATTTTQEEVNMNGKRLSKKPSFWDFFRPPPTGKEGEEQTSQDQTEEVTATTIDKGKGKQIEAHASIITAESAQVTDTPEQRRSEDTQAPGAAGVVTTAERTVRRQSSRMSFNFNWSRRARRDTDASVQSREAADDATANVPSVAFKAPSRNATMPPSTPALAARKTPRMPSRTHTTILDAADMQIDAAHATAALHEQGRRLAQDAVRFAHAAHTIKTTDDVAELRTLAADLEQAYRSQLNDCTVVHTQLEGMHWRLHDVHDENTHLRSQLGRLSEKIAEQQARLDSFNEHGDGVEQSVAVIAPAAERDVTSASAFIGANDDRGGVAEDTITSASIMNSPRVVRDDDGGVEEDEKPEAYSILFSSGPLTSTFSSFANEKGKTEA